MSPTQFKNNRIIADLYFSLRSYLQSNDLGYAWSDGTAYILDGDDRTDWVRNSYIPDVSFVRKERMLEHIKTYGEDGPIQFAPDFAVEIVSPTDKYSDLNAKVERYIQFGTTLVWVVDPGNETVRVVTADNLAGTLFRKDALVTGSPVLPEWNLKTEILFQPLA